MQAESGPQVLQGAPEDVPVVGRHPASPAPTTTNNRAREAERGGIFSCLDFGWSPGYRTLVPCVLRPSGLEVGRGPASLRARSGDRPARSPSTARCAPCARSAQPGKLAHHARPPPKGRPTPQRQLVWGPQWFTHQMPGHVSPKPARREGAPEPRGTLASLEATRGAEACRIPETGAARPREADTCLGTGRDTRKVVLHPRDPAVYSLGLACSRR
jgi:hypothetical protein